MINLPDFTQAHVLVVGDLILDHYWSGKANRISPEAPVPVVHIQDDETVKPGGAANVALNIAGLHAHCTIFGITGDDAYGKHLEKSLDEASITPNILMLKNHSTINKIRVLSLHQQLIRLDFETPFDHSASKTLIDQVNQYIDHHHADLIICSDYAKGTLTDIRTLIKTAHSRKIPIIIDPKSKDFSIYRGATLLTPNFKEFQIALGTCPDLDTLVKKARLALERYALEAILITRGDEGMSLIQKGKPPVHLSTHARDVFDVTGAGDTVIAVLGAALAAKTNFIDAMKLANLAASIVVKKVGAVPITTHELRRASQHENQAYLGILTEHELKQAVIDAKTHQEPVVMTNGCFDILHAGHIEYLEQAKQLGDRLIVAVNDDTSVRKLKGNERPIKSLTERMEILAALRSVDWVVPFSEETPKRLISHILPDILVKGGDYKGKENQIAGASAVKKNGGEVKALSLKTGYSTTQCIQRMRGET